MNMDDPQLRDLGQNCELCHMHSCIHFTIQMGGLYNGNLKLGY